MKIRMTNEAKTGILVLICLHWFNPLVWLALRRPSDEGEGFD